MYIKAFLKNSTTVELRISQLLDCKGNRDENSEGLKKYLNEIGFSDIESILSKSLTTQDVNSEVTINLTIEEVDFDAISDLVFEGAIKEPIVPLSDELLKSII